MIHGASLTISDLDESSDNGNSIACLPIPKLDLDNSISETRGQRDA